MKGGTHLYYKIGWNVVAKEGQWLLNNLAHQFNHNAILLNVDCSKKHLHIQAHMPKDRQN